ECKRGWQDGGGVTVEMTPPAVERALCDCHDIGELDGTTITRAKPAIPPALRRKVLRRDHQRCRVPGCRAHRNSNVHHIEWRSAGGSNHIENLICLCEAHHLALHAGTLRIIGPASTAVIERVGSNAFTRAERAVHTAQALKGLGYKPHEVRKAVERT